MKVKIDITGKNMMVESHKISPEDACDEKDNSSTEKLYKRYQECRDQELKRFWENSKYVWTFLAICFAGYGVLLTSDKGVVKTEFTVLSLFVSCVGIVLSFLWLRMAQGSKIWYEVYETAVWEIESYVNKLKFDKDFLIHNYWTSKNGKNGFSPSKIMILIGWILVIVWILALVFSILLLLKDTNCRYIICPCILLCIIGFVCLFIKEMIVPRCIKSSSIRTKKEEKVFKYIRSDIDFSIPNMYLYFEIKNNEVVFKFNDQNADKIESICFHYNNNSIKPIIDGYDVKYSFNEIEKYYENLELNFCKIRNKIYANQNMKTKIMAMKGICALLYTSDIKELDFVKDTLNTVCNTEQIKFDNNKIIIPLNCIKTNNERNIC